jgi:hypothetical protein
MLASVAQTRQLADPDASSEDDCRPAPVGGEHAEESCVSSASLPGPLFPALTHSLTGALGENHGRSHHAGRLRAWRAG